MQRLSARARGPFGREVYIERDGILEETDVRFRDNTDVMRIVDRIVSPLGRRVDESSPMVDARLPDGSRVNIILPPLSRVGPCISMIDGTYETTRDDVDFDEVEDIGAMGGADVYFARNMALGGQVQVYNEHLTWSASFRFHF